jgi:hypothetical protein
VRAVDPSAVRETDWLRRAEWVLVVLLVVPGLILSGGILAKAFADVASPLWLIVMAVYTVLGLAGACLLVRKLPYMKWAFALFLLAHTAMTVALLRSSPAHIDVEIYLREGSEALLHGHNPYAMSIPSIYPPQLAKQFYSPGVLINGRVAWGFPYLPLALMVAIPGHLVGDVRYSKLIAMVVTAVALRRLASDEIGRAAAVLGVASVSAIPLLTGLFRLCIEEATEPFRCAVLGAFAALEHLQPR